MWRTSHSCARTSHSCAGRNPVALLAFLLSFWIPAYAGMTEVVWYTAMNTSDIEPLRKRFEEKNPGVKLTVLRQPGEKIRNRILGEASAGKQLWDVVSFNHLDMGVLEREHLIAAPRAPIYVRQYVIGYNTSLVKPAEAP